MGEGTRSSRCYAHFAQGKLRLYICDSDAARYNPALPDKLYGSRSLAKFARRAQPHELDAMKRKYGWPDSPHAVRRDEGPCMVTWAHQRPRQSSLSRSSAAASPRRSATRVRWSGS